MFRHSWILPYYLRYFDIVALIREAQTVAAERANKIPLDALVFDRYGDGPLDTAASRNALNYPPVQGYDPKCFTALRSLSMYLASRGQHLLVAGTPLHPAWKAARDPRGESAAALDTRIRHALVGTGARYWNADLAMRLPRSSFTDSIHLRWSAASEFTRVMVQAFGLNLPIGTELGF